MTIQQADLDNHIAALEVTLRETPNAIAVRRDLLAARLGKGEIATAVEQLCLALMLPHATGEAEDLAEDAALLLPLVLCIEPDLLRRNRLRWALASRPAIVAVMLARLLDGSGHPLGLAREALDETARWVQGLAPSPYPTAHGRLGIDTVWFEVTSHCNQKCTFCPDPKRQGARTRTTLDNFKRRIDELLDGASVGSMQLNAYGEPLLHPQLSEMLRYLRDRKVPWPTFFTTHGMTLTQRALDLLAGNYPQGIAISLQNDGQDSYAATRNNRIGDYNTLASRVEGLMRAVVAERADCHLRLYQLVCNGHQSPCVDQDVLRAFPSTPDRFIRTVRRWQERAEAVARDAPGAAQARVRHHSDDTIVEKFFYLGPDGGQQLPILQWRSVTGRMQQAFLSPRPVSSYANLLPEQHPRWQVFRRTMGRPCGFTDRPSLALFASGRIGLCCLDLEGTATFGHLDDYPTLPAALRSPECLRLFAQLANGIAEGEGCRICMGEASRRENDAALAVNGEQA